MKLYTLYFMVSARSHNCFIYFIKEHDLLTSVALTVPVNPNLF